MCLMYNGNTYYAPLECVFHLRCVEIFEVQQQTGWLTSSYNGSEHRQIAVLNVNIENKKNGRVTNYKCPKVLYLFPYTHSYIYIF